ncbi:MAG: SET domain-containing protein [Cyanobacteria bacterium J06638_22]
MTEDMAGGVKFGGAIATDDFHTREINSAVGVGLFASRHFDKGEAIYPFDYWSSDLMPMHVTNHSCDANGMFNEAGMLVAVHAIEPGEEITFNYLKTRIPASPWNFQCQCGAANCVGWVDARVASEK